MGVHAIRWGIMATGRIAEVFVKDLLTDPASRDVHDVRHEVAAVASSRSEADAVEFLARVGVGAGAGGGTGPGSSSSGCCRTYGSYAELVSDPDVDIVYVATPHSHHFQNVMLAFAAGKNVLCEKALTVTAAQTRRLVERARAAGLFFMEAVWTRFFPLSVAVRERVRAGEIGAVARVVADCSMCWERPDGGGSVAGLEHRMTNPALGGGVLLDLGVYSVAWVLQALYDCQAGPEADRERPETVAAVGRHASGVDETTSIILHFPRHRSMGVALATLRTGGSDGRTGVPAVVIQGSLGEIQVMGPAYRPVEYRVCKQKAEGAEVEVEVEVVKCPIPRDEDRGGWGQGMFWEADECARCLRDGRKESATMPWSESVLVMDIMDQVLSRGGVVYPDLVATDVFDAQSRLNLPRA